MLPRRRLLRLSRMWNRLRFARMHTNDRSHDVQRFDAP